jgi:small GTP-binding protein
MGGKLSVVLERLWVAYAERVFDDELTVVVAGLDNSGKTSLLHRLEGGYFVQHPPTKRSYAKKILMDDVNFHVWDVGSLESADELLQYRTPECAGILFVVDSVDEPRIEDARDALEDLLECDDVRDGSMPVAVLLNKTDRPEALPIRALIARLGLDEHGRSRRGDVADVEVFPCSVLKSSGMREPFLWIAERA